MGIRLIVFLFFHENIYCVYSLEAPQWGASYEYNNICFRVEIRKISIFLYWKKRLNYSYVHLADFLLFLQCISAHRSPSEKESSLKGKNLLPFLLRVDLFLEGFLNTFHKICLPSKHIAIPLSKHWKIIFLWCDWLSYHILPKYSQTSIAQRPMAHLPWLIWT